MFPKSYSIDMDEFRLAIVHFFMLRDNKNKPKLVTLKEFLTWFEKIQESRLNKAVLLFPLRLRYQGSEFAVGRVRAVPIHAFLAYAAEPAASYR